MNELETDQRSTTTLTLDQGVMLVELRESPGFRAGHALGSLMSESNCLFLAHLAHPLVRAALRPLWWRFRSSRARLQIPEDVAAELEAFAAASGVPAWVLYLGNFLFDLHQKGPAQCSTFALPSAEGFVIGRNTDMNPWLARWLARSLPPLVVRVIAPGRRRYIHVSMPGFVGVMNGLNDAGISVHSHLSVCVRARAQGCGLPAGLLPRLILEQASTLAEVIEIVREARVQAPINLLVTSRAELDGKVFELLAGRFTTRPLASVGHACTTHYRSESMAGRHGRRIAGSRHRLAVLEEALARDSEATAARAIDLLQSRIGGNRHDSSSFAICNRGTFQSFVMDVPRARLHLATARHTPVPVSGPYVTLPFAP